MDGLEPLRTQPVFDLGRRQPQLDKLGAREDTMLSRRQLAHARNRPWLPAHIAGKCGRREIRP
jgi:hypothetical protein